MTFEETCERLQACGGKVYSDPEEPDDSGACHIWFPLPNVPECEMIETEPGLEVVVHPGDGTQSSVIDASSVEFKFFGGAGDRMLSLSIYSVTFGEAEKFLPVARNTVAAIWRTFADAMPPGSC